MTPVRFPPATASEWVDEDPSPAWDDDVPVNVDGEVDDEYADE